LPHPAAEKLPNAVFHHEGSPKVGSKDGFAVRIADQAIVFLSLMKAPFAGC
jgi:hypothetical protein